MKYLAKINTEAENLVLSLIEAGVFWVNSEGEIWRKAVLRQGKVVPCLSRRADRIVYRHLVGVIPTGMVIDHINRNRTDNRPENLEPVPQTINVRRALKLMEVQMF